MLADDSANYLNTTQVAQALGLSVSTVKRWVDDGVLPAYKTAGGHRRLLLADVLDLARRGELPQTNLSKLLARGGRSRPAEPAGLASPLFKALVTGDAIQSRTLILGAFRRGVLIEEIADRMIGPAMRQIGQEWESGRIDVMEEHRAAELCASVLYELKAEIEKRASVQRPRAVGGAIEQDFAVLPTLLAQMVLLESGWDAINLGPNTPIASFSRAIDESQPRILWLCNSHLTDEKTFLREYPELYQKALRANVAVAIGGRAFSERIRSMIPHTTYGDGLTHLAAFARTLHPPSKPPKRGRPKKI